MSEQSNRELLNRAWNDMRSQLDEHMPERKNKAWVIGIFALVALLLAFWTMKVMTTSAENTLAPKEVQPLLALEQLNPTATPQINHHKLRKQESSTVQSSNVLLEKHTPVISMPNRVEAIPLSNAEIINEVSESTSIEAIASVEQNIQVNSIPKPENEAKWPTKSLPSIGMNKLYPSVTNNVFSLNTSTSNAIVNPSKNIWQWSIVAGFFSDNTHSLNGGNFGLNLNKHINQRWDITLGWVFDGLVKEGFRDVLYSSNSSSLLVVGSSTLPSRDFTELERIATYNEIAQSVNGLFYMRIPMELTYWMLPRLGITSGLHVSYLIYGTNDKVVNKALTAIDSKYFYRKKVLNKTDIGISGGLSYALTKHFHLDITYRYGLSQVLRKIQFSDRVDFNRSFNMNIEYLF